MARTLTMTFFILTLFSLPSQGQTDFRVMSYNVENLFDTKDDPLTADNDFLPSGNRHWTSGRFYHKLQQLAKVITAAGEWSTPALIGLCEVENDSVLVRLLNYTPLRRQHYRYCMTHGQDTRGINVAFLYQRDKFRYQGHTEHPVRFTRKQGRCNDRRPDRCLCLPFSLPLRRRKRKRTGPFGCRTYPAYIMRLDPQPPSCPTHPDYGRF